MAGKWKTIRLGEVAQINPDDIDHDWPFSHIQYIDISSVGVGQIHAPPQKIELKDAPSRAKRLVRSDDTVLSTVRPNRRSMFFASQPANDWVVSTGFAVLRPDTRLIHPRFLYACVFNQPFTEYLITREKGAAYPAVSPQDIVNAEIPYPPLNYQQAIAEILGALDDKIECNRRINGTLEKMAMALYKHWFVDFGPFRDGKFVDSELGRIPEGWHVGKLSDILLLRKEPIKPDTQTARLPYVPIDSLPMHNFGLTEYRPGEEAKSSLIAFYKGDVLFGAMRAYFHRVCIAPFNGVTRTTTFVLKPKNKCDFTFSLLKMNDDQTIEFASSHSRGSTIPYAVWDGSLANMPIVIPPEKIRFKFNEEAACFLQKIRDSFFENFHLSHLRDYLLPKLLSGEIILDKVKHLISSSPQV